jgi:hypothetical protein
MGGLIMPRFVVMVKEEYWNKWGFDAENLEQAKELIRKVEEGEIDYESLPNFYDKNYSNETTIEHPEEVDNA